MTVFYIVISVLWGILIFLNTSKEYKWWQALIYGIVSILVWPLYILSGIVVELIHRFTKKNKNIYRESDVNIEDVMQKLYKNSLNENTNTTKDE